MKSQLHLNLDNNRIRFMVEKKVQCQDNGVNKINIRASKLQKGGRLKQ